MTNSTLRCQDGWRHGGPWRRAVLRWCNPQRGYIRNAGFLVWQLERLWRHSHGSLPLGLRQPSLQITEIQSNVSPRRCELDGALQQGGRLLVTATTGFNDCQVIQCNRIKRVDGGHFRRIPPRVGSKGELRWVALRRHCGWKDE